MKANAAACLVALVLGVSARAQSPEEWKSREAIATAVRFGECAQAVARLNEGLATKYASHYLIGGTMFEEGLCVKPNWERAQQLYQRASQAGEPAGLLRLVAGLAHESRDPGAALWWMQRNGGPLPADCVVSAEVHGDADRYLAALKSWPVEQLAACVYTAGVVASVFGDMQYSLDTRRYEVQGAVAMTFVPAVSRFEWDLGQVTAEQSVRIGKERLLRDLSQAGQRALKRYPKPTAIDPAWRVAGQLDFKLR